jgi:hypothetical protein
MFLDAAWFPSDAEAATPLPATVVMIPLGVTFRMT